jgi:hypothetical protein
VNRSVACALLLVIGIASPPCAAGRQTAPAAKAPKTVAPNKVENVKRLQPSEVAAQTPGLPPEFVEKLNTRGCTIPQFVDGTVGDAAPSAPNNVIEGEFAKKDQKDWAALCSNGKTSTIVIFWSKPTSCPSQLARLDDEHFMQKGADKKMHYSRSLYASDPARDASLHRGPKQMTHQGIHDAFVGKSSSLFYCSEGKWRIYPGAD